MSELSVDQLYKQADAFLDSNRAIEARAIYEQICSLEPNSAEARMMIGAIDGETGRIVDAISSVEKAIEIEPDYADAHQIMGRLLQSQGRTIEACDSLKRAVQLDPDFIEAWLALAAVQGQLQDYAESEQSSRRALSLDSSLADAHVNLANALLALGRDDEAIEAYKAALQIHPNLAAAWASLGTAYIRQELFEDAGNVLKKAISLDPGDIQAKRNLAQALIHSGSVDDAVTMLQTMIMQDPSSPELWSLLVSAFSISHNMNEMLAFCEKVTKSYPENSSAWLNRGFVLENLDREEEALEYYKNAVKYSPDWPDALNRLGMLYTTLERFDEALSAFGRSLAVGADSAVAHHGYALATRLRGAPDVAEHHFRIALEKAPDAVSTLVQLGKALSDQGKQEEAIEVYRQATEIDPENEDPIVGTCEAYERMGKRDQAYEVIQPLLTSDEKYPGALCVYAKLSVDLDQTDEAIKLIENTLAVSDLRSLQKMALHFSAGDLYDKQENGNKAMAHFNKANAMKPVHFDAKSHYRFIDNMIKAFNKSTLSMYSSSIKSEKQPVFIVGMPRSGTSLAEQILSVHNNIFAAGELNDLNIAAYKTGLNFIEPDSPLTCVRNIDNIKLSELAQEYIAKIESLASEEKVITDKMPTNYLWLGLIELLFPDARIIHIRRDPLDTCLSCYFKDFTGVHAYAYSLENLGSYYRGYQRLMQHWRQVLSIPLLDVDYEELVNNTESVSRSMLDFCGLDWDEEVLKYYQSERQVTTASYEQVRKPIYTTSIGRWKTYEPYISSLKDALGDAFQSD